MVIIGIITERITKEEHEDVFNRRRSNCLLYTSASQLKYDAAPVKRLGVPAYNYWNEALHGVARAGVATMFPQAIAMAADVYKRQECA